MDYYPHAQIVNYAMTQYSIRKGLNKFKKSGEAAVEKELKQLHMMSTFTPMNLANMIKKYKEDAL